MGADGGSVNKKYHLKLEIDRTEHIAKDDNVQEYVDQAKWNYCGLKSSEKLTLPIVSDYLGNLYNRTSILEWLLEKNKESKYSAKQVEKCKHIRRINDVVTLNGLVDEEQYIRCKINDEILIKHSDSAAGTTKKFVYISGCGDVLDHAVLEIFNQTGNKCPACGAKYNTKDVIPINPIDPQVLKSLELRIKALNEQGIYHNGLNKKVKSKKRKQQQSDQDEKMHKRVTTDNS